VEGSSLMALPIRNIVENQKPIIKKIKRKSGINTSLINHNILGTFIK
jgi:hypothetical protein